MAKRKRRRPGETLLYGFIALFSLLVMVPFLFTVIHSLMPPEQVRDAYGSLGSEAIRLQLWPKPLGIRQYIRVFFGTELGCGIRATGSNPAMSRAQGINTGRAKVVGLMLSNGLVALSGALLTQYQGYADVSMGRGAIVIGLAAVIIGEVLFGKIFRNFATKLIAVSIGAIIYYIVMQVVLWLGLPTNYLKLLTALVVAMFRAVPHWKSKLFTARSARKGEKQDA